MQLQKESI